MIVIGNLVADFKSLTKRKFLAKYDVPMLLHQTDQAADPQRDFEAKTKQAADEITGTVLNPKLEVEVAAHVAGVLAFEVRARKKGTKKITLGRIDTNDIQFPYSKVSMSHGSIALASDGTWYLTDDDSRNGTWINGERIPPQQPQPLTSKDVIKLGTAETVFYLPEGFYEYLTELMTQIAPKSGSGS